MLAGEAYFVKGIKSAGCGRALEAACGRRGAGACAGSAGELGNGLWCNISPAGSADGSTFKGNVAVEFLCPHDFFGWALGILWMQARRFIRTYAYASLLIMKLEKCCQWLRFAKRAFPVYWKAFQKFACFVVGNKRQNVCPSFLFIEKSGGGEQIFKRLLFNPMPISLWVNLLGCSLLLSRSVISCAKLRYWVLSISRCCCWLIVDHFWLVTELLWAAVNLSVKLVH